MKHLAWRISYTLTMVRLTKCKFSFAWSMATDATDYYNDDYTPEEAVHDEISYWD